jgi:hypothetical protein
MLHVVMFDLGDTLIDAQSKRPFPHAAAALAAIQGLASGGTKPLLSCLVSDFDHGLPVPPDRLAALFAEFLGILGGTSLQPRFEPVGERVTLSAHAGVRKPDQKIFTTALQRLGARVPLADCLLVTEDEAHVRAARADLGMQALRFGAPGAARVDFDDWAQAPLLVAHLLAPSAANLQAALGAYLRAARDLEVDTIEPAAPPGTLAVTGKAWRPVAGTGLGALDGVLVALPVRGEVVLGSRGEARTVSVDPPSAEALAAATAFVARLARSGAHATHAVEVDAEGRRRLVRTRSGGA